MGGKKPSASPAWRSTTASTSRKSCTVGRRGAEQTAEIFARYLEPPQGVEKVSGIQPQDDVTAIGMALRAEDDWMIVGHMPFVSKLASYLVLGQVQPSIFRFQNGGVVCLDEVPQTSSWIIKWALMPTVD